MKNRVNKKTRFITCTSYELDCVNRFRYSLQINRDNCCSKSKKKNTFPWKLPANVWMSLSLRETPLANEAPYTCAKDFIHDLRRRSEDSSMKTEWLEWYCYDAIGWHFELTEMNISTNIIKSCWFHFHLASDERHGHSVSTGWRKSWIPMIWVQFLVMTLWSLW